MAAETFFVNREKELAKFGEVLEDPQGQAVLVVGQAGMGKSCLIEEMGKVAANHPRLRCGWVKYNVLETDSVNNTMELMMNNAFEAANVKEGFFDATPRRLKQWRSLLNVLRIGNLVMSLRRGSKGDTRAQLLDRLGVISNRMPENGRAVFAVDPCHYIPSDSDQAWSIVIKDLPNKIKFVFAQRPDDEIVKGEAFRRLANVINIPDGHLGVLSEQSVEHLVRARAPIIGQSEHVLHEAVRQYNGHPYGIQAALDLLEKKKVTVEDLPPDPTPEGILDRN